MTIPLDPRFIPAFYIEDVLLDKDTGAPLSGGLVYFEQDNQRGIPKPVYQITGTSPNYTFTQLPNPMTLSSIGTFEDSLSNPVIPYFYPYDSNGDVELYYVRVTNSEDVPQFDREAVPYIGSSGSGDANSAFVNELSNPQFAIVDFDIDTSTYTYNFNAATLETVQIAPDWVIEVSCPAAGSVTVSQVTPVGTLNRPTNPGTILNISSAGLTHLRLRQRLYGSPNLWGSGYLSGGFTAKTYSGTDVTMTMYYSQSDGVVMDLAVVTAILEASGIYKSYAHSVAIPASTSIQDFPTAYVDIEIELPLSVEVDITSIMAAGTNEISIDDIAYDQTTLARQVDQLFHYYQVPLNYKPIPSMLVGWDFPLNPAQFLGSTVTVSTTAAYAWDQTICQSVVGNVAVIRNTVTSGFQATTANAAEAFCQVQYLSGAEAKEILGKRLSVNVSAFRTTAGGVCNVKVYLFSGRSAAVFPVLPLMIGSFDAAGVFTKNNTAAQGLNWSLIPRGNLGQALGSLSTVDTADYSTLNDVVDLDFNGWQMTDSAEIADTDKFAIVSTYSCPTTGTVVTINSIGMVPGDIPTIPAPETFDEVLRKCQRYYEKSYDNDVIPGTSSNPGAVLSQLTGAVSRSVFGSSGGTNTTGWGITNAPFSLRFNTAKRTSTPTMRFWTPGGVADNIFTQGYLNNNGSISSVLSANRAITSWTLAMAGNKGVEYVVTTNAQILYSASFTESTPASVATYFLSGYIQFHYTADARLGVVA